MLSNRTRISIAKSETPHASVSVQDQSGVGDEIGQLRGAVAVSTSRIRHPECNSAWATPAQRRVNVTTGCTAPVVLARPLLRVTSAFERLCADSDVTSRG